MTRAHTRMLRLWETQGGRCHWCGLPMHRDGDCPGGVLSPWYGSLEHLCRRGEPDYDDVVAAAHVFCNELREALNPADFITLVHSASFCGFYQNTIGRPVTMRQRVVRTMIRRFARGTHQQGRLMAQ